MTTASRRSRQRRDKRAPVPDFEDLPEGGKEDDDGHHRD